MAKKIVITIVAAALVVGLAVFGWWWFLNHAVKTIPTTGTFGTGQNRTLTNNGSPVIGNKPADGIYVVKDQKGTIVGTYALAYGTSGNPIRFTPQDGAPPLGDGVYNLSQGGSDYGTVNYTVPLVTSYGTGTTATGDLVGNLPVTGVDWFLGTTSDVGSTITNSSGTVFNPKAIVDINSSNPNGGILPNFGSAGGNSSGGGSGIAGALIGAVAIGGITCAAEFAFEGAGIATGLGIGTAAAAPGQVESKAALGEEIAATTISVSTVNIPLTQAVDSVNTTLIGIGGVIGSHFGQKKANDQASTFWGCLARTVAKIAIQQITSSVVNWINSGFQGSPSFVTNPTKFFGNVADQAAGAYIKQSSDFSFLCSPIQASIRIAVASTYANNRSSQSCSLTSVMSNVQNFANGGWSNFLSFTTEGTNNSFGAYSYGVTGLNSVVAKATGQKQTELLQGRGFLSFQQEKNCRTQATAPSGYNPNVSSMNLGSVTTANAGGLTTGNLVLGAGSGAGRSTSITAISNNSGLLGPTQNGSTLDTTGYKVCDLVNTTPGSVIAGAIDKTLGESNDSLNLAKSFDEIISALITQLVTRVLQGGLANASNNGSGYESNFYTAEQLQAQKDAQSIVVRMQGDTSLAASYGSVEQGSITDIQTLQTQLNDVRSCWVSSTSASAGAGARAASTTIAQFDAQVDAYNSQIQRANVSITLLEQLQSRALSAASSVDTAGVESDYKSASAGGQLITQNDVTTAQQNRTSLQNQLGVLSQQATADLSECQSGH